MITTLIRHACTAVFVVGTYALSTPLVAQEKYPTRQVTLIIPSEAGSSTDISGRALADLAATKLKQPIVVVNRRGASGSVGLTDLKNSKPDGYTLGVMQAGGLTNAILSKVEYHPITDFEPMIHYMEVPEALVVSGSSSFYKLEDLLSFARANPGKVTFGSAGPNIALNMARLGELANVQWTNVSYSGGAPVVTALLGGHISVAALTPLFKPHIPTGKLRLLGTFTQRRLAAYPDVPTLKELGYDIAGSGGIFGVVAPKGTPTDRIHLIHDALYEAMQTAKFKNVLAGLDATYEYLGPEAFQKKIRDFYESRIDLVRRHGNVLR